MTVTKTRIDSVLSHLDPPSRQRPWFGGASPLGCLRGVTPEMAAWKPSPSRHSIWELTLHIAYWKYAVRRRLDDSPKGGFPRSPADWPDQPESADRKSWQDDRSLLRTEHQKLVDAVRSFDPAMMDDDAPDSETWTYSDLLFGVVTHDVYHVGQIQLLKRIFPCQDPIEGTT